MAEKIKHSRLLYKFKTSKNKNEIVGGKIEDKALSKSTIINFLQTSIPCCNVMKLAPAAT
jgi:hypothetical protein